MKKLFFFLLIFMITNSYTQTISNNGFEDWTSMGAYNNPDSWTSLNDMKAPMSTYTCVNGTPGPVGATNEVDFNILQLNVIAQTINPVTTVPNSLVSVTPSYNQMLQRIGAGITIRY